MNQQLMDRYRDLLEHVERRLEAISTATERLLDTEVEGAVGSHVKQSLVGVFREEKILLEPVAEFYRRAIDILSSEEPDLEKLYTAAAGVSSQA